MLFIISLSQQECHIIQRLNVTSKLASSRCLLLSIKSLPVIVHNRLLRGFALDALNHISVCHMKVTFCSHTFCRRFLRIGNWKNFNGSRIDRCDPCWRHRSIAVRICGLKVLDMSQTCHFVALSLHDLEEKSSIFQELSSLGIIFGTSIRWLHPTLRLGNTDWKNSSQHSREEGCRIEECSVSKSDAWRDGLDEKDT